MPSKFEPATGNPRLNGVIVDADDATGKATAIMRVNLGERALLALAGTT
jgi:calcineurin-like phosphoesterase